MFKSDYGDSCTTLKTSTATGLHLHLRLDNTSSIPTCTEVGREDCLQSCPLTSTGAPGQVTPLTTKFKSEACVCLVNQMPHPKVGVFCSWGQYGGRREMIPQSCTPTSTWAPRCMCTHNNNNNKNKTRHVYDTQIYMQTKPLTLNTHTHINTYIYISA